MSLSQIVGNRLTQLSTVLAVLSGLAVMFIWSGWIVFSRMGIQSTLTASDITLLRFGTAALCTLPLAIRYPWKRVKVHRVLVVGLGCGFPYTLLSFYGLALSPAANAGVIVNGSLPIVSGILCWILLKEKPSQAMTVTIALLAIANILMWHNTQESMFYTNGVVLLLVAALVLAVYMLAVKVWNVALSDIVVWVPWTNVLLFIPLWVFMPSQLFHANISEIGFQMLYQGVVVSLGGLLLFSYAVKILGPITSSLFMAFVPMVTAILAIPVLGELPAGMQWGGLTLCSVALLGHQLQWFKPNAPIRN